MRRLWAVLVSCFILGLAGAAGCSTNSGKESKIPEKMIDLPKEGPVTPGGGGPAKKPPPPPSQAAQ
jgi:hypothetical protein